MDFQIYNFYFVIIFFKGKYIYYILIIIYNDLNNIMIIFNHFYTIIFLV